ncbi:hypothetical protein BDZ45DRAFT_805508 [Acephala macrosclerotiorum]|nr:hypothetical protein BDZ45DRAFT_805508 [Acephala macrosclerotiorum]
MPVSKKMKAAVAPPLPTSASASLQVQREHRKAEAAGTRAPVKANGLPVKAPKPTSLCANCKKEIVNTNLKQLEVHAETHDQKVWTKEKCWPDIFKGDAAA